MSKRRLSSVLAMSTLGRGTLRRASAASLVLGLAVACGGGAGTTTGTIIPKSSTTPAPTTPAPTTTLAPPGYTAFKDAADHFSIAVPTSWRQVDPATPGPCRTSWPPTPT